MTRVIRWIGFTALLYAVCVVFFFSSNIATIMAIRGPAPLTWEVMQAIFVRDALVCIPIAILGSFLVPVFSRMFRRIG
jgi:hypothetical protein